MEPPLRVLVVDDHRLFAEAIKHLLASADGLEVVGASATGEDAVEVARRERPDLILMDFELPGIDGIEATRAVKAAMPATHIVMVTAYEDSTLIARAVEAGASGFVPKSLGPDELVEAIHRVAGGELVLPTLDIDVVLTNLQRSAASRSRAGGLLRQLTSRELEILQMITEGHSTSEIAEHFFLSPLTVKSHVKNIYSKLGVHSKLEAVTFALRHGAVEVAVDGGAAGRVSQSQQSARARPS